MVTSRSMAEAVFGKASAKLQILYLQTRSSLCRGKDRIAIEAKEKKAETRGESFLGRESYGNMTNFKTDVNVYDITRGFLGTTASRVRCDRMEVWGVLQREQSCLNTRLPTPRPNCIRDRIS